MRYLASVVPSCIAKGRDRKEDVRVEVKMISKAANPLRLHDLLVLFLGRISVYKTGDMNGA